MEGALVECTVMPFSGIMFRSLILSLSLAVIFLGAPHPVNGAEQLSFMLPVKCVFRFGQSMDSQTAKTDTQKTDLDWTFLDLTGSHPRFLSGGDTGAISAYSHETSNGVSLWLKQGNGAHLFTIWPDGAAFWSKHNDILGDKATQQFRGRCINLRVVD